MSQQSFIALLLQKRNELETVLDSEGDTTPHTYPHYSQLYIVTVTSEFFGSPEEPARPTRPSSRPPAIRVAWRVAPRPQSWSQGTCEPLGDPPQPEHIGSQRLVRNQVPKPDPHLIHGFLISLAKDDSRMCGLPNESLLPKGWALPSLNNSLILSQPPGR